MKHFDEIFVGEVVTLDYYTYMKAEFRQPAEVELNEPLAVMVEILNLPTMLTTVKGPRGNYTTIPMEDKTLMTNYILDK